MALVVNLTSVEDLPGKADRMVKLTFRGRPITLFGLRLFSVVYPPKTPVDCSYTVRDTCT